MVIDSRDWYADATFTLFPNLPFEIKSIIWVLAMASELHRPRIHLITKRASKFISNQPTSPFLRICRGSRPLCLQYQKSAFQTYFNPEIDIIYLRVHRVELWDITDGETHFLRLALGQARLFNLPLKGDAVSKHIYMKGAMPNLIEGIVVAWDCGKQTMNSSGRFERVPSREQGGAAVCRRAMRKNKDLLTHCGIEPMQYRYVYFEDQEPDCMSRY